jgi:hypothetical protein
MNSFNRTLTFFPISTLVGAGATSRRVSDSRATSGKESKKVLSEEETIETANVVARRARKTARGLAVLPGPRFGDQPIIQHLALVNFVPLAPDLAL